MYRFCCDFNALHCIFYSIGNRPPGMVPNKFLYMVTDLHRLAEYFGVPLSPPSNPAEAMFEKGVEADCSSTILTIEKSPVLF